MSHSTSGADDEESYDPDIYDLDDTASSYNDPRYPTLPQFSASDFDDPPPIVHQIIETYGAPLVSSVSGFIGEGGQLPTAIQSVFSGSESGSKKKKRRRDSDREQPQQEKQKPKKLRQTSMASFLPGASGPRQFVHPDQLYQAPAGITVTGEENEFTAFYTEPPATEDDALSSVEEAEPKQVGELTLYEDDDGYWVNDVEVEQAYRRKGVATELILAACREHGTIFFSQQKKHQCTASGDTRWMTEDGARLATRLSRSTIAGINVRVAMPGAVAPVPMLGEDDEQAEQVEPEGQVQQVGREEEKGRSAEPEDVEQGTTATTQTGHEADDDGMEDEWRDDV